MKKINLFVILALLVSFLVIPVSAYSENSPLIVDLIAGQNIKAGSIKVWDDGKSLYVMFETNEPWCMTETHLAVAGSLDGIPQTNGNPIPGQFPYSNSHQCATNFLYTVPLTAGICQLYIAAHAALRSPSSTETGWGSGPDFPGNNWGTYFTYEPNACRATPTPTNSDTPTATNTATNTPTGTPPTNTPTNTATNTATGTPPTHTPTNTATNTPTSCTVANFGNIVVGQSVEGMGAVAPNLNIDAVGTAVKVLPLVEPTIYLATQNGASVINGYMVPGGGFTDLTTRNASQPHSYTFTFAPGISVNNFSVHMVDYGDLNPTLSTNHYVSMTAYNANGIVVSKQELSYTTLGVLYPQTPIGDASAQPGQPGNWTWNVSGSGIVRVVLEAGVGFDPNIAFDLLSTCSPSPTFTPTNTATATHTATGTPPTHTPTNTPTNTPVACQPTVVTANFSNIVVGQSVEGMGAVAPNLNIDAVGTAVKVLPLVEPTIYLATQNGASVINGYMVPGGGFTNLNARNASQPHSYTFTFAPGISVNNFSVHMVDYGDLNPTLSTNHYISMTAYNANGIVVSKQELSYTTLGVLYPQSPVGDASAQPGQPGNWTWNVSGSGIVRVVLEAGVGFDPNIAFDLLSFATECSQSCQPTVRTANFSNIAVGQSVEGLNAVAPNLNIDALGTTADVAVKVLPLVEPTIYLATQNGASVINGYMVPGGGFTNLNARNASQPHSYAFTFAPGISVNNFSVHMVDYGDLNPTLSTNHYVSMTAYNANGIVVSKQELSYTTLGVLYPQTPIGDASAPVGQPGNWTWNVSGSGIVRVVLEAGVGFDPNIAFDLLFFSQTCP